MLVITGPDEENEKPVVEKPPRVFLFRSRGDRNGKDYFFFLAFFAGFLAAFFFAIAITPFRLG